MTSYGELIHTLPVDAKQAIRRRESITKKLCSTELSITFNEICLRENLLPVYTLNIPRDGAEENNLRRRERPSDQERRTYMQKRVDDLKASIEELRSQLNDATRNWNQFEIDPILKNTIEESLSTIIEAHKNGILQQNHRKLVKLNGGSIKYPTPSPSFINTTNKELTPAQEELLNMGLNCHVLSKPAKHQKRVECEILIDDVEKLAAQKKVTIEPTFKQEIISEAGKARGSHTSKLLTKRLIDAARQLREDPTIKIRKADKTASYVIMDAEEYLQKLDTILSDPSKFQKLNQDPTEKLKKKLNQLIETNNAVSNATKLNKVIGDFKPGYCYGNVKTHKPGNKLRPIISQIPTPTYQLAKRIAALLEPFIPSRYILKSSSDFLDILKNSVSEGTIASFDVESLFTNVPVDRTINYILNKVYRGGSTPPLNIPENILRNLLECCTKEAPFICPRGNLYCQVDGVAMGSPLGVLFANFFMGCIEEEVFRNINKPAIYCRYIDDIFIKIQDEEQMQQLHLQLKQTSGLNFTIERSNNGTMPFLDILVTQQAASFNTSVYVKKSNMGHCLNGVSECPQRYKDSTISAFIRRALTHCSSWPQVHQEIERATQVLINNGFPSQEIERTTRKIIDKWYQETNVPNGEEIKLYYRSIFSSQYQEEERAMRQIIKRNVKPTNPETKLKFTIYYKNKKTSHLLLKNSPKEDENPLQRSHVIYRFTCTKGNCAALQSSYIDMTTVKLGNRLTNHRYLGAPKNHMKNEHRINITKEDLETNTEVLASCNDPRRLPILEALYIKELNPSINIQAHDLQALPSVRRSQTNTQQQM